MARFGRIWPGKWQDQAEQAGGLEAIAEEWQQGLEGMSGQEIKHALEYCRQHSSWPPSIAEFRAAAGDGSTQEQLAFQARLKREDAARLALPSETSAEAHARNRSRLAELMAILKGHETRSEAATATPEARPDKA
jgi:hypothetical protein